MVGILVVGVAIALAGLALYGKASSASDSTPAPDDTTVDTPPPNVVGTAVPVGGDADGNVSATPVENWQTGNMITTDIATWPAGDRVWDVCRAIALAEGYNTNGAAFKLNNPGDISDGAKTFGAEFHDGSNITHFPDAQTGWNWLYQKIDNHISGKSSTYPASLTITEFAKKYAGSWQNWKGNVGNALHVNPDTTTFKDYVG